MGMKKHFLEFWNFNNIQFSEKNSILKNLSKFKRILGEFLKNLE